MSKSGPINWEFALKECNGDENFLREILGDLFADSERCSAAAEEGIANRDFKAIDLAAHEVKGSCMYLGCDALKEASYNLEMAGKRGQQPEADKNALIEEAKRLFVIFKDRLAAVQSEAASRGFA